MAIRSPIAFVLITQFALGANIANWGDLPLGGIDRDMRGDFVYDSSQSGDFVLNEGIFFTNSSATLTINATISGDWGNGVCGMVFCSDAGSLTFTKGNLLFYINSSQATNPKGIFSLTNGATLDINSNLSAKIMQGSDMSSGVFSINNSTLNLINAKLMIDLSEATNPNAFVTSGSSKVSINNGDAQNQSIAIKGNLVLKDSSMINLNLVGNSSFLQGGIALEGQSSLTLTLSNQAQATITEYSQSTTSSSKFTLQSSTLNGIIYGAQTNLDLSNGSTWNVWESNDPLKPNLPSQVGTLSVNNSTINLALDSTGVRFDSNMIQKTLRANALNGSGTFILYSDVGEKMIDTTHFSKASGNHSVQILYNPLTFSGEKATSITQADGMVVATIDDTASKATFSALPTIMGLTSYTGVITPITTPTDIQWTLTAITPSGESDLSKAIKTALNTPYRLFDFSAQTLNLRLGDLRKYPKDYGLFFHYTIAQNQFAPDSSMLGIDELAMNITGGFNLDQVYRGHTDFLGFGFEINLAQSDCGSYSASSQSYGGFLSYTSIWDNRFFYDFVLKYAYSPTAVDFSSLAQEAEFSTHWVSLSGEVGKKFAFNSGEDFFYILPQGKVTTGMILPTSLQTKDDNQIPIQAQLDWQFPLLLKSALYLGYEWNGGFVGDIQVGAFIDYSLYSGGDVRASDLWSNVEKKFDMDFDVGLSIISNFTIKDFLRFYLQFDSSFLGTYTHDVLFNVGVLWSFGDRYVPPPPPPADPNRLKVRPLRSKTIRNIPTVRDNDKENMKHYEGNRQNIINSYSPRPAPTYNSTQEAQEEIMQEGRMNLRDTYQPSYTPQQPQSQGRYYKSDRYNER